MGQFRLEYKGIYPMIFPMSVLLLEIGIVFLLLIANGVFAMTEIAIISAKKSRLRHLAQEGNIKAKVALELAESPNRFLSTVQIGITLVGIFAGAFGGATLAEKLAQPLSHVSWLAPYARQISFGVVIVTITYFSLVLGELVPKRIGLSNPEKIAMLVAGFMSRLSRCVGPVVSFLSFSTNALLRLFGVKLEKEVIVSEEEVKTLMQEGLRSGAFNRLESEIVSSALELDKLRVRDIMTPRPKVIWINKRDTHEVIWHKVVVSNHSSFPVYEEHRDNVVGMVSVKALYANLAAGASTRVADLMVAPLIIPATQTVIQLLESFKKAAKHMAMVVDEFGSIIGVVTLHDVMEATLGEFPSQNERAKLTAKKREDGSWLIDAMIDIEELEKVLPGFKLSSGENLDYQTLAGFVVKQFGHLPKEGETFEAYGYLFEVLDLDRHRVDKVLVIPKKSP